MAVRMRRDRREYVQRLTHHSAMRFHDYFCAPIRDEIPDEIWLEFVDPPAKFEERFIVLMNALTKFVIVFLGAVGLIQTASLGRAETIEIQDFQKFQARQLTAEDCWAACLQMMLNENGINWDQTNIVESIRGKLDWSGAQIDEITQFLNGWKCETSGQPAAFGPGQRIWAAGCEFIKSTDPRLPNPSYMPRLLANQRPLITCIKSSGGFRHAVVVFKIDYEPIPGAMPIPGGVAVTKRGKWIRTALYPSNKINSLTYYDPYDGSVVTEEFEKMLKKVEGYWSAHATTGSDMQFRGGRF
jgi:hypothetical protein